MTSHPIEVDFDAYYARREAERILAHIGFDPMFMRHRAEAVADAAQTPEPKRPATLWADIAAEAVFYSGLGMPVEDVCEVVKQTPGVITRSLRRAGQGELADSFAELLTRRAS